MFYCIVNNHDCPNKDCAPSPPLPPKVASVDSYFKRCRILLRVVYYLQNISGKSGWKVNATRLFGHSSLLPPESKIVLDAFVAIIRTTRFFPRGAYSRTPQYPYPNGCRLTPSTPAPDPFTTVNPAPQV